MSFFKKRQFVDYRIVKVFDKINDAVQREVGKTYHHDIIEAVLKAQSRTIVNGMAEGDTILCKYFGTFVATQKRRDMLNKSMIRYGKSPGLVDTGLTHLKLNFNKK